MGSLARLPRAPVEDPSRYETPSMPNSTEAPNTRIKRAIPITDEDMSGKICT